MAHKKQHSAPVPPGNQPAAGPPPAPGESAQDAGQIPEGAPLHEQDPQRRLGDYGGAGEHPLQQPGGQHGSDR